VLVRPPPLVWTAGIVQDFVLETPYPRAASSCQTMTANGKVLECAPDALIV